MSTLRTDSISEFVCSCVDDATGSSEVDNAVEAFAKDRSAKVMELANVRWCGIAEAGSLNHANRPAWVYVCRGQTLQR